jgi:hypothetical protein
MTDYSLENITFNKYRSNQYFLGELFDQESKEAKRFYVYSADGKKTSTSFEQTHWELDILLSDVHIISDVENGIVKKSIKAVGIVQEEELKIGRLIEISKHKNDYPTDTYSLASIIIVSCEEDREHEFLFQAGYYDINIQIKIPKGEFNSLLLEFKEEKLCVMSMEVLIWSWFNDHALLFCERHEVTDAPRFKFNHSVGSIKYTSDEIRDEFSLSRDIKKDFVGSSNRQRSSGIVSKLTKTMTFIFYIVLILITIMAGLIYFIK